MTEHSWRIAQNHTPEYVLEASTDGDVTVFLSPELAVDANRDGGIKLPSQDDSDATTESRPYRFWINNDIDRTVTVDGTDSEQDPLQEAPDGKIDSKENIIPCERDLQDFSRLWIYLPALRDAFSSGKLQIGLKWAKVRSGDPAIRMYPAIEADGGTKYLTEPNTATQQIGLDTAVQDASDTGNGSVSLLNVVNGATTFILPKRLFQSYVPASSSKSHLQLIFEGVSTGVGELQLVLLDDEPDSQTVDRELSSRTFGICLRSVLCVPLGAEGCGAT